MDENPTFESSFKTIDALDYSSIATIDVKRYVYDLAVNKYASQIAIVENQGVYHAPQESVVRLYDVGRRKDDEDEQVNTTPDPLKKLIFVTHFEIFTGIKHKKSS